MIGFVLYLLLFYGFVCESNGHETQGKPNGQLDILLYFYRCRQIHNQQCAGQLPYMMDTRHTTVDAKVWVSAFSFAFTSSVGKA